MSKTPEELVADLTASDESRHPLHRCATCSHKYADEINRALRAFDIGKENGTIKYGLPKLLEKVIRPNYGYTMSKDALWKHIKAGHHVDEEEA